MSTSIFKLLTALVSNQIPLTFTAENGGASITLSENSGYATNLEYSINGG